MFARTLFLSMILLGTTASYAAPHLSDGQIRAALIRESLASYPGNCPCPYNTDRCGRACGSRSAYSRPGGYAPLCYEQDITPDMIARYRRTH